MKDKVDKKFADVEVVIGDDSNLEFTDAKDCVNTLRPKDKKHIKEKVIVPKTKNEK